MHKKNLHNMNKQLKRLSFLWNYKISKCKKMNKYINNKYWIMIINLNNHKKIIKKLLNGINNYKSNITI